MELIIITIILLILIAIGGSIYFRKTQGKKSAIEYIVYVTIIIFIFSVCALINL